MAKIDYIAELENRHGPSPEIEELKSRYAEVEPSIFQTMTDQEDVSKVAGQVYDFSTDNGLPFHTGESFYPVLKERGQVDDFTKLNNSLNGVPFDGPIPEIQQIDVAEERPGLFKRFIKKVGRSFVNTLATIRTKSQIGQLTTEMTVIHERMQAARDAGLIPGNAKLRDYFAIPKETRDELTGGEDFDDHVKRVQSVRFQKTAGFEITATPEAKGVAEKAIDVAANVSAFVAKLAITKKAVGAGASVGGNLTAWETLNLAEGGTPGAGAAMYVALVGIDKIPVEGTKGFFVKTGSQSAVFAGTAAVAGGDTEAIITAALLPWALRGLDAAAKGTTRLARAKLETKAVKNLREIGTENGLDLSKVPDSALKFVVQKAKQARFWNKQFDKGKVTKDVRDQHLKQVADEVRPVLDAIGRQQPVAEAVTKEPVKPVEPKAIKPDVKPVEAPKPVTKPIAEPVVPKVKPVAKKLAIPKPPEIDLTRADLFPEAEVGTPELEANKTFLELKEVLELQGKSTGATFEALQKSADVLRESLDKEMADLPKPPPQEPRLVGGRQAGGTTIIPDVVTEVGETSKRLGSNLSSAARATKEIASRNVKRYSTHLKSLGEEGKSVSKDFDEITIRSQKRINNSSLDAKKILKGVSKENRERIAKAINGKGKAPPKWIKERADKLRDVLDELLDEANVVGIQRRVNGEKVALSRTGKAFPQVLNATGEKIVKQAGKFGMNSPDVIEVAEEAVELGFADSIEEYVANLQRFRQDQLRGLSGYLERTRFELPERFLEWDPDRVLDNLFQRNWMTIEGVRQWGPDSEGLSFPRLAIKAEGLRAATNTDEFNILNDYIQAAFGKELKSSDAARKISGAIRGYQFLTKIAMSSLTITRNMLDRFNKAAAWAPLSVQLKTIKDYPPFINQFLKHSKELEEEVIRRGAVFSNTAIGEGYQPGHLLTKLAGKAFASSELGNQVHIAIAKKNAIEHNLKILHTNPKIVKIFDKRLGKLLSPLELIGRSPKQARNKLRELGNDELIDKLTSVDDISPELLDAVLHRTVRDNAFPVVLSTKRSWWDNKPFWRIITQFKVWGVDQVGHIWNDVIKTNVKNRDPSQIVSWLVAMAVTGEIYNIIRDFILAKDESLLKTLSDKERRNLKEISLTILKDIIDGGAVGIIADIVYGLPNLIGGPTAATVTNLGEATVKSIWNPTQAKDAIKQIAIKETPALRQAQGLLDKIDARFDDKNITQEYYKTRRLGFEWAFDKKNPKASDKAKQVAVDAVLGWITRVPQKRTLSFEMATRQIIVGDVEDASDHFFFLFKRAGDDPEELSKTQDAIRSSLNNNSPLGKVAQKDQGEFFSTLTKEQQNDAMSLQMRWNANAAEAFQLAVAKWEKWRREQK